MEDRETLRIHKYGETKMTQIMMATVRHVCQSRTYEISGRLIFVEQSVHAYLDIVTVFQDGPLPNIYSEWLPQLSCPLHTPHMHLASSGSG
jgi:hypothetical protein